ncbi:hypothetical protein LPB90_09085 [Chryseobacterium sp. LC2016-29]|uniref:hypothetical protein n=1 Tax=Chryseobacterium sp. LC2016-29 TaxID=2897331 RepID=UPI001E3E7E35|nr:hypothetical protein [Chryseobacterium sp. LC2016-29]MCD0478611.1 hypothetical protein [Chryseobacterium sp. LC2016-29]
MITKQQALENAKDYINKRKRNYVYIDTSDKVKYEENKYIYYGKYDEQNRNIYVVNYDIEGYTESIPHFIALDAEIGEVLFTAMPKIGKTNFYNKTLNPLLK